MATPTQDSVKGYNILCLDGGSLRGLSQLTILEELLHKINFGKTPKEPLTKFFDLIIGSGCGAVLAVLIGKFGMSIDEAKTAYVNIIRRAFGTGDKGAKANPRFDANILKEVIKEYCDGYFTGSDADFKDGSQDWDNRCRVAVCASNPENAATPYLFRTYERRSGLPDGPPAKVWDVLHASMATPGVFDPIMLGEEKTKFYNTALKGNNPVQYATREISSLFGEDAPISTIISIGSGHPGTISYRKDGDLADVLRKLASDAETSHEEMRKRMRETTGVYYRFNVMQGFSFDWNLEDEWNKHGLVITHTKAYMDQARVERSLIAVEKAVLERKARCVAKRLASATDGHSAAAKPELKLEQVESYR